MRVEEKKLKLISVDTLGIITYQIWMIVIMSLLYQFIIPYFFFLLWLYLTKWVFVFVCCKWLCIWNSINIFTFVLKAQLGIKPNELNWIQTLHKRILTECKIWMNKNIVLIHAHTHTNSQWKTVDPAKIERPCSVYTFRMYFDCLWTMIRIKFDSHVFKLDR